MTTPDPSPVPESTPKPTGSAGPSCAVAAGSASALWNHMAETHNLHLLASEESDIRHAANAGAEAEIRDLKNRMRPWMLGESYDLRAENDRLRGIIARNAMQRLDGTKFHITPEDINASLEICADYRERPANDKTEPQAPKSNL